MAGKVSFAFSALWQIAEQNGKAHCRKTSHLTCW